MMYLQINLAVILPQKLFASTRIAHIANVKGRMRPSYEQEAVMGSVY